MKISISCKHSDCASMTIMEGEKTILEHDGYMPNVGIFGGDYTELEIDNQTGLILNWKPITVEEIAEAMGKEPDGDDNGHH